MNGIGQDVRYALRALARAPGFAAAVAVILALGIGANAMMFGVIDRLYLRPPAGVTDADQVVHVLLRAHAASIGDYFHPTSWPAFTRFRDDVRDFDHLAVWTTPRQVSLGRGTEADSVRGSLVSADYFRVLGVRPAAGRFFAPDEEREPLGVSVAVIGYALWQRRFGGSPSVVGRDIDVGQHRYTVIGVAPRGFNGPTLDATDLWLPVSASPELSGPGTRWYSTESWQWLRVVGHVRHGVSLSAAVTEATTVWRRVGGRPGRPTDTTSAVVLGSMIPGRTPTTHPPPEQRVATLVAAVSLLVLLMACANVANLLLSRAMRRDREIAVRLALGIGRRRLIRMLLTESVLLAIGGGVASIFVAAVGLRLVAHTLFARGTVSDGLLNAHFVLFTALAALGTGLLAGLVPALQASRPGLAGTLRQGSRQATASRSPTRTALLVLQGALSVVLLAGTGLFVRSLRQVGALDLGMDLGHILAVRVDLGGLSYTAAERDALWERVLERVRAVPGVESASLMAGMPFWYFYGTSVTAPGQDSLPSNADGPYEYAVTPGFLRTMGTRLYRGRAFREADRSQRMAIVNRWLADALWQGEDPVGQCVHVSGSKECTTIVGVTDNARNSRIVGDSALQIFLPLGSPESAHMSDRTILVRTAVDPEAMVAPVRRVVQAESPLLPYPLVRPLESFVDAQLDPWRLGATMFSIFGALALAVGLFGTYSVLSYAVTQRVREMGIRMALGANGADVVGLVVAGGLRVAIAGTTIGLLLTLALGPLVRGFLFQVSPRDPMVLGGVVLLLLLSATLASLVPALRAARVDPATTLRSE